MLNEIVKEFENKNIVILGFGKEGKSTYQFIRKYLKDIHLTIKDKNEDITKDPLIQNDPNLTILTGATYLDNLEQYDLIMKTPGISFKDIDTTLIRNKISSELEILLKYYKKNIIGITGTKGKSTTSSLIYEVLKKNKKKCFLLGNIGIPIFDFIEQIEPDTLLVVEMSSHQLEFVTYSPHIAIMTNLYEDHLDHTNSVNDYYQAKLNIARFQDNNDFLIYYKGCSTLDKLVPKLNISSNILPVDFNDPSNYSYCDNKNIYIHHKRIYDVDSKRNLIGNHNLINIMLTLTLSHLLSLDNTKTCDAINHFKPLEHRLEKVGTFHHITYYNDAIATIPDATINGIEALGNVNTLIFGGLDRGINYKAFIKYLNQAKLENLICMPTTGHKIANELIKIHTNKNIYLVDTLEEAVQKAKLVTKPHTICLMSPAAASYEYFKNFEEKGNAFKKLVKEIE